MNWALDDIEAEEFNKLMDQFIECEDPYAMTATALDKAAQEYLDEVKIDHRQPTADN